MHYNYFEINCYSYNLSFVIEKVE